VTPLHIGAACAATLLTATSAVAGLPLLAIGMAPPSCAAIAQDGTPAILSPTVLNVADLRAWWASTGRGQPASLTMPIDDLIAAYLNEAATEGVRGDLTFTQALVETSYFTSPDTAVNNFAGIAHYDDSPSGRAFPDAATGVRAHVQLLHKFAAGNATPLAHPDIAPQAGAAATTWGGLAATWATDPGYWTTLNATYQSILGTRPDRVDSGKTVAGRCAPVPFVAGDYALPVDRHWYDDHPDWFTKPHHDHPAADIPVPTGTPIYATTSGTITTTTTAGDCGTGIILTGNDGAQYTYCHGLPASVTVTSGETVHVGQQLMLSASTGNSTGPHLHFAIRVDGQERCPQNYLVTIADGRLPDTQGLAPTGCTT
jgi:hypothetical protein